jgi:glycosyltransferase involved in cell wall biosynthesis
MSPEVLDINKIAPEQASSRITLSIIVPAFNESDNLLDAIRMITAGIPAGVASYEIIIIDDGSRDSTPDIVRELTAADCRIHGISHDRNLGKGAALLTGFNAATMEWILFTDADLQIHIRELPPFLEHAARHDIIIGYRQGRRDSFVRVFSSSVFARIVKSALGLEVRDINCPFKLIRKSVLEKCTLRSKGFFIDTELLYRMLQNKARIKELGVACRPRQKGESTVRFRHVVETVRELIDLLGDKNPHAH